MYAIRFKGRGPQFRRDGVTFYSDRWVLQEEVSDLQREEPLLEIIEVTGAKDRALGHFPIDDSPVELPTPEALSEQLHAAHLQAKDAREQLAELAVDRDGLAESVATLSAQNADLQTSLLKAEADLAAYAQREKEWLVLKEQLLQRDAELTQRVGSLEAAWEAQKAAREAEAGSEPVEEAVAGAKKSGK